MRNKSNKKMTIFEGQKARSYYQTNKTKITIKRNMQLETCECGKTYQKGNRKQHRQSIVHQVFINEQNHSAM